MPERDVFKAFADTLRQGLGTPVGQTEEVVKRDLRLLYQDVFDAVGVYNRRLQYQSTDLSADISIVNADDEFFTMTCQVTIAVPSNRHTFRFKLSRDGIQADRGYLSTANETKGGWWPVDQQTDFIERLGFAILEPITGLPT